MNRKLNIILAAVVAGAVTTAYATCYLGNVIGCFSYTDLVAGSWCFGTTYTFGSTSNPSTGCSGFTANVYADENAYRYDLVSVSVGGKNMQPANTYTSYCSGQSTGNGLHTFAGDTGSFEVYYLDANVGSEVTGWNGPSNVGTAFFVTTAHYLVDPTTACN